MKNMTLRVAIARFVVVAFAIMSIASCKSDENHATDHEVTLNDVVAVLGGYDAINRSNSISYVSEGSTFEWEQPKPTETNPLNGSNYKYKFTSAFNERKVKFEYEFIKYNHPFPYDTYGGLLIINDRDGAISGQYNWLSYYFGYTEARSLYPSRLEAILKNQQMANPIGMIKDVIEHKDYAFNTAGKTFLIPTIVEGLNIELEIDSESKLPARAKVMEEDYLNGDVEFQVQYDDWKVVDGINVPHRLTFVLNGNVIKKENLSAIKINPALADEEFKVQDRTPISYDENNARMGVFYSQWHHRWIAWGILIDQPLDNGALVLEQFDLSPFDLTDQTIDPDIKIIGRPDLRTWSVSIKTPEGIVVVEAPLNTFWTKSCLKAIKREYPAEKLICGISTHTHHVTFGGIRELAHEVGKIYVNEHGYENAKRAIDAKHTLVPDVLATDPRKIDIVPVKGITKIVNGFIEIHTLETSKGVGDSQAGPHAHDMLVVYIPEKKVLIQADHYWSGEYMLIWNGKTQHTYTTRGTAELKRVARHLLDYIEENNLDVDKIIGIHGGFGTLDELKFVCQ